MSKKIIITDLHFGAKNNDQKHNQDLYEFFKYLVTYGSNNDIDELFITGDIFQQRDKLDVYTINAAMDAFGLLSDHFTITAVKGNHDLYFRDSRDVGSLRLLEQYMHVVDHYEIRDDMMFVSWVCNQKEYEEIVDISKKNKIKYMFSHFEFSTFAMNDNYIMEHGQTHKELSHVDIVFTGHYHKRQIKDNVIYVGTPFPFDFNDANDSERGFCVFDHDDGTYEFCNYGNIKVLSMSYDEFMEAEIKDADHSSIRIIIDKELDPEQYDSLKEKYESMNFRETKLNYKLSSNKIEDGDGNITLDDSDEILNIDASVIQSLEGMTDNDEIDKDLLKKIYEDTINNDET